MSDHLILVYEISFSDFPGCFAAPYNFQGDHFHILLGVARKLEVNPNWALGVRVLTAVKMFFKSLVYSSACLTNVLLSAVGLSAGQQVQAHLICAGHVLEYGHVWNTAV